MHTLVRNTLFCTLLLTAVDAALGADGTPDPGFGENGAAFLRLDGVEGHELRTYAAIALPDGKLLFAGARNKLIMGNPDPHERAMLARMNADGSADTSFGSDPANPGIVVLPDLVPGTGIQQIEAMRVLPDGDIIAAGTAQAFGPLRGFVVKLDAAGALDPTFGIGGIALVNNAHLHTLGIDSQGRIVVAGERVGGTPLYRGIVARFSASGMPDTSFGTAGDGVVAVYEDGIDQMGYFNALAIAPGDGIVVGGSYQTPDPEFVDNYDFSIASLKPDGSLDDAFAGNGWHVFRVPGTYSDFDGIDELLITPRGQIVFAGHFNDVSDGVRPLIGRLDARGYVDPTFGVPQSPGFNRLQVASTAWNRYPTGLVRQDDGKLVATVSYAGPDRQEFLAVRTDANGRLDAGFGTGGIVALDLAPAGVYSDATALTLHAGRPLLAGASKRAVDQILELAAVRLENDGLFTDGFDSTVPPAATAVSDYDDALEGSPGLAFGYNGITYREANGIGGVFPDGSTFTAADVGEHFIVEDATVFFKDFPDFGSTPNVLTFGTSYMPGSNVSIGAFVRATLELDAPAGGVSLDIAYYENGPWGGIEFHADAYRNGSLVGSDMLTIAGDDPGRDNPAVATLSIDGVEFDTLRLYATYGGQPSAPRMMLDNLALAPVE